MANTKVRFETTKGALVIELVRAQDPSAAKAEDDEDEE